MKRYILKESQYKTLLSSVVKTQMNEDAKVSQNNENTLHIEVEGNWKAGYHSFNNLPPETKSEIESLRDRLNDFILSKSGYIIKFTIDVGESLITNNDKEVTPNKPLKVGELSKKRGSSLQTYFKKYYETLVSQGVIRKVPEFYITQTIGKTPYSRDEYKSKCGTNRQSSECIEFFKRYEPEQYVKIKVEAISDGGCIADLVLHIGYIKDQATKAGRPTHTCNMGVFDVLLNGIRLGTANINNYGKDQIKNGKKYPEDYPLNNTNEYRQSARWKNASGGDNRMYYFKLNPELAKQVAAANPNEIAIKVKGLLENNHNDVPYISVGLIDEKTGKPKFIYNGVPVISNVRGSDAEKELGALDACATKVIRGFNT